MLTGRESEMSEGSRLKLAPAEWPEIVQELRAELAHTKAMLESERAINAQLEEAAAHYRIALDYLRRRSGKVLITREDQLELARQTAQARLEAGPVLSATGGVAPENWDEPVAYRVREPRKPL
jgi:hypothetical protein